MKKKIDLRVSMHPTLKKLIMELKISILIIIVSLGNLFASNAYSQTTKVTLNAENKTLEQIMDEIEQQSEFYFVFNQKQIDIARKIDVYVEDKIIDEILPDLFKGTNINYAILDRKILLTIENIENSLEEKPFQQQFRISGTVTDAETGEVMPGVNVLMKGTSVGTLTDTNGKYSFAVPDNNAILIFSFIGYSSLEVSASGNPVIDVRLASELTSLEEVVVIGYGTVKKATVTGSISTVKGDQLQVSPAINFANTLGGRLTGLVTVTPSGEPGKDGTTLRIRGSNTLGNNSPLIVVDGIANRDLERLNPADIESITVLKDASAAIYGAQAANGVILVTTKRGSVGKLKLNINLNQGLSMPTKIPEMADAATYATMLNETDFYRGNTPRFSEADIQLYKDGSDPWGHPNTDWFAATFKPFSLQQSANLSMNGGYENISYYVSFGARYNDAISLVSLNIC